MLSLFVLDVCLMFVFVQRHEQRRRQQSSSSSSSSSAAGSFASLPHTYDGDVPHSSRRALDGAGKLRDVPANGEGECLQQQPVLEVYPVEERGGFVWLFYGDAATPEAQRPPIPVVRCFCRRPPPHPSS